MRFQECGTWRKKEARSGRGGLQVINVMGSKVEIKARR